MLVCRRLRNNNNNKRVIYNVICSRNVYTYPKTKAEKDAYIEMIKSEALLLQDTDSKSSVLDMYTALRDSNQNEEQTNKYEAPSSKIDWKRMQVKFASPNDSSRSLPANILSLRDDLSKKERVVQMALNTDVKAPDFNGWRKRMRHSSIIDFAEKNYELENQYPVEKASFNSTRNVINNWITEMRGNFAQFGKYVRLHAKNVEENIKLVEAEKAKLPLETTTEKMHHNPYVRASIEKYILEKETESSTELGIEEVEYLEPEEAQEYLDKQKQMLKQDGLTQI